MTASPKTTFICAIVFACAFYAAGCHNNSQPAPSDTGTSASTDDGSGATSANLVPVSNTSAPQYGSPTSAPQYGYDQGSSDSPDESEYGIDPDSYAPQPPPPLPDYSQPECPGDDYEWTPGYWDYASGGYYWVPGAWVQTPYVGALWTPGYWVFHSGRYAFYHGYWGPHIGFYGGINYGFGYVGVGYVGGYWNGNRYFVNRRVNNINISVVHNVYERNVTVNNYVTRVSYNGGQGGVQARPQLAELAALREPHAPPMQTQIAQRQAASENHAQFAAVNHGRPAEAVLARPVAAARDVRPVTARVRNLPAAARPAPAARPEGREATRPEQNAPQPVRTQPGQPERVPNQPVPTREASRPVPASRPAQANRPEPAPSHAAPQMNRPEPANRAAPQVNRAEPASRPQPAPSHAAAPQSRPQPVSHAAPEPRETPHAAPASHPAPKPKPAPKPEQKKEDQHPPQ